MKSDSPPDRIGLSYESNSSGTDRDGGNPVISPGAEGEWDAAALGSLSVILVGESFICDHGYQTVLVPAIVQNPTCQETGDFGLLKVTDKRSPIFS